MKNVRQGFKTQAVNPNNPLWDADSYKFSHFNQVPDDLTGNSFYISARADNSHFQYQPPGISFVGAQPIIMDLAANPVTQDHIEEAEPMVLAHGEPFNREGLEYIVKEYGGHWPARISTVPEGLTVPFGVPLVRVDCYDRKALFCNSFLETRLMRVWYPSTVSTISRLCRSIAEPYVKLSSTDEQNKLFFLLQDFGSRGVSSPQSAGIGGMAHLAQFGGTDTFLSLIVARNYYDADIAGFSIPAAEHSTITAWGKDRELQAYKNMLDKYAKPGAMVAVVSDSYSLKNALNAYWGTALREQIVNSGAIIVIRPDSGDPLSQVVSTLYTLEQYYGTTTNAKGYKVLNNVRVIQGDGIDPITIHRILSAVVDIHKFSVDNVTFGMGGKLLQDMTRDTFSFAEKCSSVRAPNAEGKEVWTDVFKDPEGGGKTSRAGILGAARNPKTGVAETIDLRLDNGAQEDILQVVYDGTYRAFDREPVLNLTTFDKVRQRTFDNTYVKTPYKYHD